MISYQTFGYENLFLSEFIIVDYILMRYKTVLNLKNYMLVFIVYIRYS